MRHSLTALFCLAFTLGLPAAPPPAEPAYAPPRPPDAEYGRGLTPAEARAGWVSLFDGRSTFGWTGASFADRLLAGGTSTLALPACDIRAEAVHGGELVWGARRFALQPGAFAARVDAPGAATIRLGAGLTLRALTVRPPQPRELDLSDPQNWKLIPHPSLPRDRQATWQAVPDHKALRAVRGPGCVELPGAYADFVLQVEVTCLKPLTNAGVFFRSRPGDFLNGYEAQIFNGCFGGDPDRPALYATGAIDKRQNSRGVVSRDGEPFTLTVIAAGAHVATWVNGVQQTDWTDTRPPNDNARQGLRLKAGPIQLQAHDAGTDVEYSNFRIAEIAAEK